MNAAMQTGKLYRKSKDKVMLNKFLVIFFSKIATSSSVKS